MEAAQAMQYLDTPQEVMHFYFNLENLSVIVS